ncbi:universal stress protein [Litoreibacter roseus]|uniref:Universal stress protein n=1 Tax=Litoreibacter roseus TaxID=2601869 RepID=A0A6N6JGZ1_9RHOB|nr:universal stress protein [Litoreibacter roseus]GFE65486.1 universal stress protein [Litoreibacter roseus]
MDHSTILFVINQKTSNDAISDLAHSCAARQIHLACFLLGSAPELPTYAYGVPPYGGMNIPDNWQDLVDQAHQTQRDRVQEIEGLLSTSGVSGDVQSVMCPTRDIKQLVAHRARVCDIAHIASNVRDAPEMLREAAHGILFNAPVGLLLNGSPASPAKRVFVAWDSSKAASRSIHAAMPYLKEADDVIIGCFDPVMTPGNDGADPGTDVAAWLSHHGCKVMVSQYPSGGREIGDSIIDRAKEAGVGLVVMGAYGHARMIEAVFGGTTKTMMEQTDLPVLLAH